MSHATVLDLIEQIKKLPEEERGLLESLLAREEESEWNRQAAEARRAARDKGIDQEIIDQAVQAVRRGG